MTTMRYRDIAEHGRIQHEHDHDVDRRLAGAVDRRRDIANRTITDGESGMTDLRTRGYREGEHITVPNPDGHGRAAAMFMAPVDPDDVPEHGHDLAWIRYTDGDREGTTGRFHYVVIEPAES